MGIEIPDSSISCNESRNNLPGDGSTSTPNRSTERTNDSVATEQSKQPKVMDLVRWSKSTLFVCIIFICIIALFIATFTIKISLLLPLQLWIWFAFVLIISCSWLVTERTVSVLVFLIERYFVGKTSKVLYFGYGLRRSAMYFFWLGSILLAWLLLIGLEFKGSKFICFVTSTLATCVIGTGMWILKILILKVLACGLYGKKFFDEIQDLISQQYVLQTLLGPSMVLAKGDGKAQLKWITEACVNIFRGRRLFIICNALDKTLDDVTLINHEVETFVDQIFKNFKKNEVREINEADLLQVMKEEDVAKVLKLFEGAVERKVIDETCLKNWMVKVYDERKTLVHLLNDTNIAIKEFNDIVSLILLVSISIIWLLLMGFVTNKVLVSILSSLFAAVFMFGNTNNTICEGIMFVFVRHPFDKGDFCLIDNEQMIVEEIGIIKTVFLKENNDKMDYPNSDLAAKIICNLNRSPQMSDTMELFVEGATSDENIAALKLKLNEFLESMPEIQIKEIDDGKLKFGLHATHTINFQSYRKKNNQIVELKKLFEELGIKYLFVQ